MFRSGQDCLEGGCILIDKPTGWTSFDVVNKIRWLLKKHFALEKIKVGHAGTLDPLATGLMVLCTGKKTKELQSYQEYDKEYLAGIRFGKTTPSLDLETEFDASYPFGHIDEKVITEALGDFRGEILQVPPVFSAKKMKGKRAYKYAREGSQVTIKENKVTIHELEMIHYTPPLLKLRIRCSKGTYIRGLARDLGVRVNSGAYLDSLRRTRIGPYMVDTAYSIEKFEDLLKQL